MILAENLIPPPTSPLEISMLALLALAYALQMLIRRRKNGNGHVEYGFTPEQAGQIKQQVLDCEEEIERFRKWRYEEYVNDLNLWAAKFVTRDTHEAEKQASVADRARLWAEVTQLRQELRGKRR